MTSPGHGGWRGGKAAARTEAGPLGDVDTTQPENLLPTRVGLGHSPLATDMKPGSSLEALPETPATIGAAQGWGGPAAPQPHGHLAWMWAGKDSVHSLECRDPVGKEFLTHSTSAEGLRPGPGSRAAPTSPGPAPSQRQVTPAHHSTTAFTLFSSFYRMLKVCSQHFKDDPPGVSPVSHGAGGQHTGCFSKELINDAAYFGGGRAKEEQPLDAQPGLLNTQQVLQAPYKSYKQTDKQGPWFGEFS